MSSFDSATSQPLTANVGKRFLAFAFDFVLAVFCTTVPTGLIVRALLAANVWAPATAGGDFADTWLSMGGMDRAAVTVAFYLSTGPIYSALFESSRWQATVGKRMFGMFVATERGERLRLGRSLGRVLVEFVGGRFGLGLVSLVTVFVTRRGQAVHDLAVKSVVLRGRPKTDGPLDSWRIALSLGIPILWSCIAFLLTM